MTVPHLVDVSFLRQEGQDVREVDEHERHGRQEHGLRAEARGHVAAQHRAHREGQAVGGQRQTVGRRALYTQLHTSHTHKHTPFTHIRDDA